MSSDIKHSSDAMAAQAAYQTSMALIRERFISLDRVTDEARLLRAERVAFQVRKIIEGVAYAALSAVEHINSHTLAAQRTKDADKLLTWLHSKGMLRLPNAQRMEPPPSEDYAMTLSGATGDDITLEQLKAAYSRASALVHERHPERFTPQILVAEAAAIEEDARRLRCWLWLHIMFLRGEGFLLQMGEFGTPAFFVTLTRQGDLPTEL